MSNDLDGDIKALLAGLDAPAEDEAFVGAVMRRATLRPARTPPLQVWAMRLAALLALIGVTPFLTEGAAAVLTGVDLSLVTASVALSLTGWMVFSVMTRSFPAIPVNMTKFSRPAAHP